MKENIIRNDSQGFTLIEVMIAVTIIGIITAFAVPSYLEHVRRAERGAAQAKMLEIAGLLENNFLQRGQYRGTFISAINADDGFNVSPNADDVRYRISISPLTDTQVYTITATPIGSQANDRCGVMTINNSNQKTSSVSGTSVNGCW